MAVKIAIQIFGCYDSNLAKQSRLQVSSGLGFHNPTILLTIPT